MAAEARSCRPGSNHPRGRHRQPSPERGLRHLPGAAPAIARKPASISNVDAASVPVIAVTAWQALFEQAAALRGQSVLIHGAAGNVGAFAVQFARQAGIRVVATCAQQDLPFVRGLGAEEVFTREGTPFESLNTGPS